VAVTRAKALLVIIGDPKVLSLDPLWRSFLNYIYLNGGWKGHDISWDPNEPVREDGGYDVELREHALADMNGLARRLGDMMVEEIGEEAEPNDELYGSENF